MKSRFVVLVCALGLIAAACSSGNPIASVDGVRITDEDVYGFYTSPPERADPEFSCTARFLIATEVYVEAARTDLGITVTADDIDDYLADPPDHRSAALQTIQGEGGLSDEGVRAQARRWALLDRVVDERIGDDEDLLAAMVLATGALVSDVVDRPSAFISLANNTRVIDDWTAELTARGDVASVEAEPLFVIWNVSDLNPADVCEGGLARVGNVGISEEAVLAMNAPGQNPTQGLLDSELEYMILNELIAQEADRRFGITVSDADISAFLASPPSHWVQPLVQLQGDGRFSDESLRVFSRRFIIEDAIVSALIRDSAQLVETLSAVTGASREEIEADPIAFIPPQQLGELFFAWLADSSNSGVFVDVSVDPAVGAWDPESRSLRSAGG